MYAYRRLQMRWIKFPSANWREHPIATVKVVLHKQTMTTRICGFEFLYLIFCDCAVRRINSNWYWFLMCLTCSFVPNFAGYSFGALALKTATLFLRVCRWWQSLVCNSTYCTRLKSPQPCHSCFVGVALVADHRENTVQAVPALHKMFVRHAPDYIASLLTPASDIPSRSSLHSSSNCDLVVPRTSRKIGDRAFSVAAPRAWNRLPTDLKLLRWLLHSRANWGVFCFMLLTPGTLCELWNAPSVWLQGAHLQVTVVTVTMCRGHYVGTTRTN